MGAAWGLRTWQSPPPGAQALRRPQAAVHGRFVRDGSMVGSTGGAQLPGPVINSAAEAGDRAALSGFPINAGLSPAVLIFCLALEISLLCF